MKAAPLPIDEPARLAALRGLALLDTPSEERFERITRLARRLFDVPMASISLVDEDRQWFKSHQGLEMSETPREVSFCGHAILGDQIMEVSDAAADARFHDNPLVTGEPHVRFYAGCPLHAPDGSKIGTLCLMDRTPRTLSPEDHALLRDLAEMTEQEFAALRLATTDDLTGLSNRRGFIALAQQALAMCRRVKQTACLSFFDLDGLKTVNDRFGHAAGDELICRFANVLVHAFRDSDVIARLGGDEFVVLMTYCSEAVAPIQRRLQEAVDERNASLPADQAIRFSVGTVKIDPAIHRSVDEWLHDSDTLMYRRKQEKRRATAGEPEPEEP
ncbi:sensor domain-containing diguanylate cyclase [Ideonella sp. YS5]|uniref:sensor domain-containing diguanylate cyclase n=1 Tax=Ideonella sp. YS5 TaxID=3453714 RepID=UPI003EE9912D